VPVEYEGDAWQTLGHLKAAADRNFKLVAPIEVPELGAPHGASWDGFLRQHKIQFLFVAALARAIGLFQAANLLPLAAAVLAALSFYGVSRYFRARPEWALMGASAFALSPFLFFRSLGHMTLTFYWPVPLAILAVTWAFGRHDLRVRSTRFAAAAAIAVIAGLHNIYYAALLAQFLALAALARALGTRRLAAALAPIALLLLLVGSVLVDNANVVLAAAHGRPTDSLARPFGNLERYALKPIELVVPIANPGLAPWAPLSRVYVGGALYRGEMGGAYLGIAGVAALVWLAASVTAGQLRRSRAAVPPAFLAVTFILSLSVVGGLNSLLGTLGFVFLRATSRYSIWILALALLWAVGRVSRSRFARRSGAPAIALLAAVLALADQLPRRREPAESGRLAAHVASDAIFARSLEAALPDGAMLFQLPVVPSPEGPRVLKATDYEHLRPYLYTKHLRFSYGTDKGDARAAWQTRADALDAERLADALERIGFAGLIVNRKAYEDGAEELRKRLAASGRQEAWESPDHDFLFVRLRPAARSEAPDAVILPAHEPERSAQ
jgi:phosphoglycerol transferase